MEEEREPNRRPIFAGKKHLGPRMRTEEIFSHLRRRRRDFVRELFVFRERANEIEDERNVGGGGGANRKCGHDDVKAGVKRAALSSAGARQQSSQPITCRSAICADDT